MQSLDESQQPIVPGDVLVLLTQLQELPPGLYVVRHMTDGWAVLGAVIDDEATERLVATDRTATLPVVLLDLFMPVGIHLGMPS